MRKDDFMIMNPAGIVSFEKEEKDRGRKFWLAAFLLYGSLWAVYFIIDYIITWSRPGSTVLSLSFYIIDWTMYLLFTGLIWYGLNFIYHRRLPVIITGNILLFAANYFLWLLMQYLIFHSGHQWLIGANDGTLSFRKLVYLSSFDIGGYVLDLSAFYALKIYFEYRKAERQRIKLALINKDMQLNLLKKQLSPHFYFNTLNNLYGLARSNSINLPVALSQLSNIMQYVILDCNQPKVLLSGEIKFLQSYIALEKLRYEPGTVIDMKVEGDAGRQEIIPLLLIQFVENAFKHGMKEKSEKNWLKVNILIHENKLLFQADNSYYDVISSEGIGMNSVKHILRLQYEGKHDIKILHENNQFSVTLTLYLS